MFNLIEICVKVFLVFNVVMGAVAYLILLERRMAAWVQDRHGPNRVGIPFTKIKIWGLGQPIADGVKFLFKESYVPASVDKIPYLIAPVVFFASAVAVYAVLPFGGVLDLDLPALGITGWKIHLTVAPQCDVGVIYMFALSGLAVYGVIVGGWASNNKYSLLGGLRASAALIAYEIPMGMAILGVVLATGSMNLDTIVQAQSSSALWFVFLQPLGFLVFMVASLAEAARLPFDLSECEQELIAGYHTEYTGMKLATFLAAEFIHMVTAALLISVLFLGGWHFWGLTSTATHIGLVEFGIRLAVLGTKTFGLILLFMLIRWSWPRFRFDQLMDIAWKVLLPLGMINLVGVAVLNELRFNPSLHRAWGGDFGVTALSIVVGAALLVASVCGAAILSARDKPLVAEAPPGALQD